MCSEIVIGITVNKLPFSPCCAASWPCLCSSIFQYVSQIPSSRHSQPLLMSRLENLLLRVRSQIPAAEQEADEEDLKAGPSFQQIPWDEIIALCIDHRLKDWRPPECPVSEGERGTGEA